VRFDYAYAIREFGHYDWFEVSGAEKELKAEMDVLRHASAEGWELVSVASSPDGYPQRMFFKRPL